MNVDLNVLIQQLAQLTLAIVVFVRCGHELAATVRRRGRSPEDRADGRSGALHTVEAVAEFVTAVFVVCALIGGPAAAGC